MGYKVVWDFSDHLPDALKNLAKIVEDLSIYGGWKPQGGISVVVDKNIYYVCQAMVKMVQ